MSELKENALNAYFIGYNWIQAKMVKVRKTISQKINSKALILLNFVFLLKGEKINSTAYISGFFSRFSDIFKSKTTKRHLFTKRNCAKRLCQVFRLNKAR